MDCDLLVLGFGKAGKTLAMDRAARGDTVVLVERSRAMYGGTCINIGCVPTKTLLTDAHRHAALRGAGTDAGESSDAAALSGAQERRNSLVATLNAVNKSLADDAGVIVVDGEGSFLDGHTVRVTGGEDVLDIVASTIVVDTGSTPVLPDIPGIDDPHVVDSTSVQQVAEHPRRLAVIGGGPIGLEFATMFADFGAEVTVLDRSETFLPRVDRDIAEAVAADLAAKGVSIRSGVDVEAIEPRDGRGVGGGEGGGERGGGGDELAGGVEIVHSGGRTPADLVLVAVGRRPATDGLGLEGAGIATTERGAIEVDEHLRTSVEGVYATGDVTGGPQFTYVSYDDHRVVLSSAWGDGSRTTSDRIVPTCTFVDPPLATVGMGEEEARADTARRGHTLDVRVKNVADIPILPRPKILGQPEGRAKFLVDAEDDRILGATLYCVDAQELVNLVTLAMRTGIPASVVGSGIYTHPSSSEVFNALLA